MMKKILIHGLFVLISLGLCGCPFYWNHDSKTLAWKPQNEPLGSEIEDTRNQTNLKRLEKGMDREQVYGIMGMPDLYGQFVTDEDRDVDVFYYYTHTRIDDGAATGEECTPLVLKNGKLEGWGKDYYANLKKPAYLLQ